MSQVDTQQMREDLAFVKEAVQRRRRLGLADLAINVVWGLIVMFGLILADFRRGWILTYWIVAGIVGWVASFLGGWLAAKHTGEADSQRGLRELLHWGTFSVAIVALFFIGFRCQYHGWQLGQMCLLLGGLTFLLEGVHADRSWLVPGAILLLGSVATVFLMKYYVWSLVGVGVFVSLTFGSLLRMRSRERRGQTT